MEKIFCQKRSKSTGHFVWFLKNILRIYNLGEQFNFESQFSIHGPKSWTVDIFERFFQIFSIAALACVAKGLNIQLDEGVSCDNFGGKFDIIKNVKPRCVVKDGPFQKRYRCNLHCTNGNTNRFFFRPIKVRYRPGNPLNNQTVIMCCFSAKQRTPILIRIQNTIHPSQPNTYGV